MDEMMTVVDKYAVAEKAHELDGSPASKTVEEYTWWVGPTVDALRALGYVVKQPSTSAA